jgi:sulfite reductase (ferredoxin)
VTESERALPGVIDQLEQEVAKLELTDEVFTIRMTGCPNGCARPYNADVGLVGKTLGKYTVLVGGRCVGDRLNFIYRDAVPTDQIVATLLPLLAYFKQDRHDGETFGDFCHRKGLDDLSAWAAKYPAQGSS